MRRRRLFWQLYPATLLIALAALALIAWDTESSLRRFYLDRTAAELQARARLAESQVVPLLAARAGRQRCPAQGNRRQDRCRLQRTRQAGRYASDGDPARWQGCGRLAALPQEMDNHASRPEVKEALEGERGVGVSLRPSDTLKQDLHYVAVRVENAGRTLGVVRAATSLASIDAALAGIRWHIAIACVLIAAALATASLLIARRVVRPLEELSRHAEWFARGDLGHRLPPDSTAEIGGLAETLNKMAAELNEKLATVVRQRNERDAILSSMVEGVLAIDADERVLSMNAAAARLLGADAAQAEGRSLSEIVRNIDLHKLVAAVLSKQQPLGGEVVLRDPKPRCLHVHGTVLRDSSDGRAGALLVVHDVTELRRLESIRRDFVANVSHELKTPVTSIQGYVETLLDGAMNDAEEREKFLRVVAKHTERLHAILEDLLVLARVEQEGERRENLLARGPIRPVLEAALADCAAKADEKHMCVTLTCPDEILAAMNASLLEQAVVNLLDNAIAYSAEGEAITSSAARAAARSRFASAITAAASPANICRGSSSASIALTSRGAASRAAPASAWPSSSTSSSSTAAAPPSRARQAKAARSHSSCRTNRRAAGVKPGARRLPHRPVPPGVESVGRTRNPRAIGSCRAQARGDRRRESRRTADARRVPVRSPRTRISACPAGQTIRRRWTNRSIAPAGTCRVWESPTCRMAPAAGSPDTTSGPKPGVRETPGPPRSRTRQMRRPVRLQRVVAFGT